MRIEPVQIKPVDDTGAPLAAGQYVLDVASDVVSLVPESGATTPDLDDLGDVDTTGVADGNVLTFDSGTSEWVAAAPTGGGSLDVEDEGVSEATGVTVLNFTGAGVTATDAGGGTVDVDIPGGAGSAWTKYLDNALTATTGFTTLTGTWGAGSGQIAQTGTAAQYNRLYYATRTARALGAIQCEVRYDGGGSGATRGVGILCNHNGAGNSASFSVFLVTTDTGATWNLRAEADGFSALLNIPVTYTTSTYATIEAVYTTSGIEISFNGTYKGLVNNINTANRVAEASYVGLMSYAATGTYRNLKVWGITPPF